MKSYGPIGHLLARRIAASMVLALALGACSLTTERTMRPEALSRIRPSHGPVELASVRSSATVSPNSWTYRAGALANLPKPLLAEMITPDKRLQCVPYARDLSQISIRGDAWTWWGRAEGRYPRSGRPKAGSVMVLKRKNENSLGHVAYVEEIVDSRTIVVSHANWLNEGRLHNHTPVRDISEANDWSKVRFWNTPGGHFGGNNYHPYGFIYPNQTFAAR